MEHAWVGNGFVNATVERLRELTRPDETGTWATATLAWVGDYSRPGDEETPVTYEHIAGYAAAWCDAVGCGVPWRSPYEGETRGLTAVSWEDREMVRLRAKAREGERQVHPLPLLTAVGNGMGSGDYRGKAGRDLVGRWAYRPITLFSDAEMTSAKVLDATEGFVMLPEPTFSEDV